jgi:hypothetical protein
MNTHEIVNLIIGKFGGNRVKFILIKDSVVWFVWGGNEYRCYESDINKALIVKRAIGDGWTTDHYSIRVESILNGMVRTEDGKMVAR